LQAKRLLLHQYHLLHLQVCLLQEKVDLAFLLHPVVANELFRPGTRSVCPCREVLVDSLGLGKIGIMFYVHLPKGTLKSSQSILPCGDDAFPAIQLPLLGKELLLQLDGPR
jgi:hypothetical protein